MFFKSLAAISEMSIDFVKAKYPNEFINKKYSSSIFEIIELIGDELAQKNGFLFIEPFINQLVDVNEIDFIKEDKFLVKE